MTREIELLVLDVDGVLTDNRILLMPTGEDLRSINFRDLDALTVIRRLGVRAAILSGENGPGSWRVAEKFGITDVIWGAKDKGAGLLQLTEQLGVPLERTCYVGDSDRDAPAITMAGVGMAPADATPKARAAADHVLSSNGGAAAVAETVSLLCSTYAVPNGDQRA